MRPTSSAHLFHLRILCLLLITSRRWRLLIEVFSVCFHPFSSLVAPAQLLRAIHGCARRRVSRNAGGARRVPAGPDHAATAASSVRREGQGCGVAYNLWLDLLSDSVFFLMKYIWFIFRWLIKEIVILME